TMDTDQRTPVQSFNFCDRSPARVRGDADVGVNSMTPGSSFTRRMLFSMLTFSTGALFACASAARSCSVRSSTFGAADIVGSGAGLVRVAAAGALVDMVGRGAAPSPRPSP